MSVADKFNILVNCIFAGVFIAFVIVRCMEILTK